MPGIRGRITRAKGGEQRSVYLSDVFGLWPEEGGLHLTFHRGKQKLHTSITERDGLLYDTMLMLYQHGQREGVEST